jgi:drug/metabolite transporter (DMT)-like permease
MWGIIWYPLRVLENHGWHGLWLTLAIYLSALIMSLPRTGVARNELIRHRAVLLPLAVAAGWTNIAFVLAILDGNVLRVLLLFYLSPLWAVLMGWLFLGERVSRLSVTTLLFAMTGALMMLWHPTLGLPWPQDDSDWLALTSGFAFAVSNVLVRKGQSISIAAKALSAWLGVVLLAVVMILSFQLPASAITAAAGFGAVALGVFGIMVMTILVQYGVTHMPVQRSAVILLFELVAGAVSQQLLTNEVMTTMEWIGGGLIIAAAYVSARV